MYIDDCISGTKKIFNSNSNEIYNVGSSEQVSIDQMIDIIEEIANIKIKRKYLLDKPKGVRGRSSNNEKIIKDFNWEPSTKLKDGLEITFKWVYDQIKNPNSPKKFRQF